MFAEFVYFLKREIIQKTPKVSNRHNLFLKYPYNMRKHKKTLENIGKF